MAGQDEPTENAAPHPRREPPTIDLPASEVPTQPEIPAAGSKGTGTSSTSPAASGGNWRTIAAALAILLIAILAGGAWWLLQQGPQRDADVTDLKSRLVAL